MRPEDSGSATPGAAHRPGDVPWPGAARQPDDRPGGGAPHHDTGASAPQYDAGGGPHDDTGGNAPHGYSADGGAPDDDWPDDDWPEEADDDQAGPPPWPGAARAHGPGGQPGRRWRRPLALTAVAVAALAVGAGGAAAAAQGLLHEASLPAAPPASAPTPAPSGGGAFPGGGAVPGGSGTARLFMAGRVVAVTPTSITIGGPAHQVTAAVTAATRVSGRVTSIRSVKVGDQVSAQITERGGKATATTIQDPARLP
ncbi:MAG TPA: hypothetical protein VH480_20955 [Streptosporangiaceae bacterium]|jgi:hypothetical protein